MLDPSAQLDPQYGWVSNDSYSVTWVFPKPQPPYPGLLELESVTALQCKLCSHTGEYDRGRVTRGDGLLPHYSLLPPAHIQQREARSALRSPRAKWAIIGGRESWPLYRTALAYQYGLLKINVVTL